MGKKYTNCRVNLDGLGEESKWYTLTTITNYEAKIEKDIKNIIERNNTNGLIEDVFAPLFIDKVITVTKTGKNKVTNKTIKVIPNYIFVKAKMTIEVWQILNNISGVQMVLCSTGIPVPTNENEINRIKSSCNLQTA